MDWRKSLLLNAVISIVLGFATAVATVYVIDRRRAAPEPVEASPTPAPVAPPEGTPPLPSGGGIDVAN
jgi:hypothetical protein